MQFSPKGTVVRTDMWREGEYLDLWSVPHFLSGMLVAFTLYFVGFDTPAAIVIAFLLLVAYEMFEVIVQIQETRWNRILDVVVGMVSFTPTFIFSSRFPDHDVLAAFAAVAVINGILSFFGWRASRKAIILERKLLAEYEKEKEKLVVRRDAFKEKWKTRKKRRQVER